MTKNQKIILAVIVAIILALIIIMAALIGSGYKTISDSGQSGDQVEVSEELRQQQSEEASRETQKLIDDVKKIAQEVRDLNDEVAIGSSAIVTVPTSSRTSAGSGDSEEKEQGVIIAPGSSILSLSTGDVLTEKGEKANNEADPGSADAPKQSFAVNSSDLPESTIKLTITSDSITPDTFTVKAGQAVSLAATAGDDRTQIFRFESESLKAVALGLAPGETRSITFNAPTTPGEYVFFSDMSNHKARGSVGTMIVE